MEKNNDTSHRVTIHIPKKIVNNALVSEILKIGKTANINGFRKGKIPIQIIQKKYGHNIHDDVFQKLTQKFFYEFIHKNNIQIIGNPKYHIIRDQDKKKEFFEYFVIYEKYPKFSINDITHHPIKKIIVNITDEDIEKYIQKSQKQKNWTNINKKIKKNDRVTIDYNLYENNKKIEEFHTKTVQFIVSKNTFIYELDNKIINHLKNDIFFFTIKFHSFYPEKTLRNKNITFKVKIKKIERLQEIEENNIHHENTKITQSKYQMIRQYLKNEIKKITEENLENQIINNVIEKNLITLPKILLEEEKKKLFEQYKKYYREDKNKNFLESQYHIDLNLQAQKQLYLKIIIDKIISENKLLPKPENIKKLIKNISLKYKKPLEIIQLYHKNDNFKNVVHRIDIENQAMLLLKQAMTIIKETYTLNQFVHHR